jgi:hypothetical protein
VKDGVISFSAGDRLGLLLPFRYTDSILVPRVLKTLSVKGFLVASVTFALLLELLHKSFAEGEI